jgi:HAD superfamily hydrolase (TIGR01509 family)
MLTLTAAECRRVIIDMDGVVTDTARVRARAWKEMFDSYPGRRAARGSPIQPFDLDTDYRRYVDGKAREDGVRSFLASRGIRIEEGHSGDPSGRETVYGFGTRKNELFLEHVRDHATRFEDAVNLIQRFRAARIRTVVISASKNARKVLAQAGVAELFETRVDGVVVARMGLRGKPEPDVFLEAARRLATSPAETAILEDVVAGLEAGRAGGFRSVIGVARSGEGDALQQAGAHTVVRTLSEIAVQVARSPSDVTR